MKPPADALRGECVGQGGRGCSSIRTNYDPDPMQYRPYGKTGKLVSVLSAGGARFSDPSKTDEMADVAVEAAKLGINLFDTAPGYANDRSETILGAAFKEMKRLGLPFYVSTKTWAPTGEQVFENLEKSLERLGLERIDFYHCWGVNSWGTFEERRDKGALAALCKAKEQGLVGHVVFSSHADGATVARIIERDVFEGAMLGFSAINFPFRMEGVAAAAKARVGLLAMNPLGGGLITEHEERFRFIRTREEQSMLEAGLAFILSHTEVTSALVGFRTKEDVRTAVASFESFEPIAAARMVAMKQHIEDEFDELCTTCNYCKGCPEGVPVASLMEVYNHYVLYKNYPEARSRLDWYWGVPSLDVLDRCAECRQCEQSCTQELPILDRLLELKALERKRLAAG
jgi:hypothetical protein